MIENQFPPHQSRHSNEPLMKQVCARMLTVKSSIGVALLVALLGCSRSGPRRDASAAGADLVLITLDTTRQDRLGCYGRKEARTPNIDRLAATGARFQNAY